MNIVAAKWEIRSVRIFDNESTEFRIETNPHGKLLTSVEESAKWS